MTRFRIHGLGTARPVGDFAQQRAASEAEPRCCHTPQHRRMLQKIYRQSAVRRRGVVLIENGSDNGHGDDHSKDDPARADSGFANFYLPPGHRNDRGPTVARRIDAYTRHALPLAQQAARAALDNARTSPDAIAHLVVVSCTGFSAPGVDIQLIDALGLRPDVTRTMIGFMGCHGAINGLRTADGLARQTPDEAVLLCCVELCSLHFQYGWDAQRVVANALFADGAAAMVGAVEASGGDAPGAWRLAATGSCLVPDSRDAMRWAIGDHGFEMTLSPRVPRIIEQQIAPWLTGWLNEHDLSIGEIGSWAVHPGGPRVLDAVERGLSLPAGAADASRRVLADHGNMSSPTVLFILDELRRANAPRPCVSLAFGPGLMIEAALFV